MPIMSLIYFLQRESSIFSHIKELMLRPVMDKQTLSFASVFGISRDAGLAGEDYSLLGSIL